VNWVSPPVLSRIESLSIDAIRHRTVAQQLNNSASIKGRRTQKNPWAKSRRLNQYRPYTFGLHAVVLLAQWDVYRIPLAFRLVRRKGSQGYQSEQALFGQMPNQLVLPPWCSKVMVVADAAYASRQNLLALQARRWWFIIAFLRSWTHTLACKV